MIDAMTAAQAELEDDGRQLTSDAIMAAVSASHTTMPSALAVEGTTYAHMPELGELLYLDDDGNELDMATPAARKALLAWKRWFSEQQAAEAARQEQLESGPDDLHLFHVEHAGQMAEFESGRRWVRADDLVPGSRGSEGVLPGHGVVIEFRDDGQTYRKQYRVLHVADGIASFEPGERVGGAGVVFHPKSHHREWLEFVSRSEGMTVDRFLRRLVGHAYMVSELRAPKRGNGVQSLPGQVGANEELAKDLEAGRRARAAALAS
ncbi:MAG: hypothetical protein Unbinned4026contig1001_26 [Prokaryotic dsDNA virus sp.]|nr:MAG: hypothetical protein Unbinned4026contig1001_26 [Prokaryotic dsDNA virus sp.]|tara:strand:- start:27445 stop:28236 length:792 start_codon:yes stop_codon:yes gene_type:complete